ncbi:DASH family cryptochrome [Vibrio sp. Isolate34]|uniref:DASH family cryptochrome n=1 Tax=Vibrio sp. Isolate34 TaxID=2908540 RepID=UPI001EFED284|nr:DASH family cryptochrome [Vibrio sp. Isolate34]MCG9639917.1 DASH family cryptochrome [Vibrio sp. Isolate34]
MKKIGLYLFTNDLRINDNLLLHHATQSVDELICVIVEPTLSQFSADFAQELEYGSHRRDFVSQSIVTLATNLEGLGQKLILLSQNQLEPNTTIQTLSRVIASQNVTHFFASAHCGYDERSLTNELLDKHPNLISSLSHQSTLFEQDELPFELSKLPRSFTKFRMQVEHIDIDIGETIISHLPPAPASLSEESEVLTESPLSTLYVGGETAGLAHLKHYFSQSYARSYKQTRNAFDGIENSTKFSSWLALGCVSPKTIYRHLKQFEAQHGANDSTYWIYFELLWREFFYWKGLSLGSSLFGTSNELDNQNTSTTSNLCFAKWKSGNTNYPIVDACMRQLNATGYMSNRGRQLVASCLIYELGIDWRHGAAYFESQLIDYDVASNWGNWAYIAGALNSQANSQDNKQDSANQTQPKSRHFDLVKQIEMYDPNHTFINKWQAKDDTSVSLSLQEVI